MGLLVVMFPPRITLPLGQYSLGVNGEGPGDVVKSEATLSKA